MASERDYSRQFNGVLAMTITDLETGIIRAQRLPTNAQIDDNPDIQKITGNDSTGRETNIGSKVMGFKPVLTLNYSGDSFDLNALKKGRKIKNITLNDLVLPKEMQVLKSSYAGVGTGKVGFGIMKDAVTTASTMSDNLESIRLVQQEYDDFTSATPNSFAVGENFARLFSDDLVRRRAFVHLETPMAPGKTVRYMDEETFGPQKIEMLAKNTNDTLVFVRMYNCIIDPSGTGLNPKAESTDVVFDISGLGRCDPYVVYEVTDKIACDI